MSSKTATTHIFQSGMRNWPASMSRHEIEVFNPQAWDSRLSRESWQVYKESPPMPSSCPNSCSVSCIPPCQKQSCCQYPPNVSTQSPAICPSQCAICCDNMCPEHYCPASSEQSIFLTKSTSIGNVKPNFPPPQSTCNQSVSQSKLQEVNPTVILSVSQSFNQSFIQLKEGS